MKNVLIITGSPRRRGVCARYAEELAESLRDMDVRVGQWNMAESSVAGCNGCEACRRRFAVLANSERADAAGESDGQSCSDSEQDASSRMRKLGNEHAVGHVHHSALAYEVRGASRSGQFGSSDSPSLTFQRPTGNDLVVIDRPIGARVSGYCIIRDDMQKLYTMLDAAEEVHVVCPVYFAGPPGQFKCVLDRLQPYWELRRGPHALPGAADAPKRPVTLHIIGAGGDPFGFAPLETVVRSSFGAAGFRVSEVIDRVGWGQPESESEKQTFPAPSEGE